MADNEELNGPITILVISHGWVVIGMVLNDGREDGEALVAHAHTVDRWGTTEGLAELCHRGPRDDTTIRKLIPFEDQLRVNRQHILFTLNCDPSKWLTALEITGGTTGKKKKG